MLNPFVTSKCSPNTRRMLQSRVNRPKLEMLTCWYFFSSVWLSSDINIYLFESINKRKLQSSKSDSISGFDRKSNSCERQQTSLESASKQETGKNALDIDTVLYRNWSWRIWLFIAITNSKFFRSILRILNSGNWKQTSFPKTSLASYPLHQQINASIDPTTRC